MVLQNGGYGAILSHRKNYCLNRTGLSQAPPLRSIGKAATSVLPPLPTVELVFSLENALTDVALVARPCAPSAQ